MKKLFSKKTKKVFSKEKFLEYEDCRNMFNILLAHYGEDNWVNRCDGLTETQIATLGYLTHEDWMIEVEDE